MPKKPIRIPPGAMPRDHQPPPRPSDLPVGWRDSTPEHVSHNSQPVKRWTNAVEGPPEPDAP